MAFWRIAEGDATSALYYQQVGAGLTFAVCLLGWYLFLIQLLIAVDFPVVLPVVDLSQLIKGGTERKKEKDRRKSEGADVEQQRGSKLQFWKK